MRAGKPSRAGGGRTLAARPRRFNQLTECCADADAGAMSRINKSNVTLYPEQALAALARLEAMLTEAQLDARVDDAIRMVPGKRAMFRGSLDGRDVVYRIPLSRESKAAMSSEWAELARVWKYMSKGRFRVAEPVYFRPDTGLLIVEFINGSPLLAHLWSLEPQEREPFFSQTADWLHAYMAPTIEQRKINRRPWRVWAAKSAQAQPHQVLASIEKRLLQQMNKLSRSLGDADWRTAIPHGDFHLMNVIHSDSELVGIDTGGSFKAPIYKDMARALTHMARRGMIPSGRRRFGVDEAAYDAFVRTFGLSDREANAFLPYMITFETLIKPEHPGISQARIDHALSMSESLFQDLKQIT